MSSGPLFAGAGALLFNTTGYSNTANGVTSEATISFVPELRPMTAAGVANLELIDELSPGVLKVNGPFLYVVMPMRLS